MSEEIIKREAIPMTLLKYYDKNAKLNGNTVLDDVKEKFLFREDVRNAYKRKECTEAQLKQALSMALGGLLPEVSTNVDLYDFDKASQIEENRVLPYNIDDFADFVKSHVKRAFSGWKYTGDYINTKTGNIYTWDDKNKDFYLSGNTNCSTDACSETYNKMKDIPGNFGVIKRQDYSSRYYAGGASGRHHTEWTY